MTLEDEYVGLRCFSRNNLSASERRPILFFGGRKVHSLVINVKVFSKRSRSNILNRKFSPGELKIVRSPRDHINKVTPLFTNFLKLQKFHERPELYYNLLIRNYSSGGPKHKHWPRFFSRRERFLVC